MAADDNMCMWMHMSWFLLSISTVNEHIDCSVSKSRQKIKCSVRKMELTPVANGKIKYVFN